MLESFFASTPDFPRSSTLTGRLQNLPLEPCYNSSNPRPQRAWGFTPRRKVRFMRRQNFFPSIILAFVFFTVASQLLAEDDELRWLDNYREAMREAKRTQKPIFLEFRCEP